MKLRQYRGPLPFPSQRKHVVAAARPRPAGLLQATGWPSVVSVMANWFGKGKRGLIMGVWNAHTSVGECWARRQAAQRQPQRG